MTLDLGGVQFQREKLTTELVKELLPLHEKHYEEVGEFQDIPLEIEWEAYWKLDHHRIDKNSLGLL